MFGGFARRRAAWQHATASRAAARLTRRYDLWLKTTSRSRRSTVPGKRTRITSKGRSRRWTPRSLSCAPPLICAPSARLPGTSSAAVQAGSPSSWGRLRRRREGVRELGCTRHACPNARRDGAGPGPHLAVHDRVLGPLESRRDAAHLPRRLGRHTRRLVARLGGLACAGA